MEFENYKLLSYKSVAQFSNNITFSYYYYKMMLIVRNLFEWENLPNNMEARWIERYLFSDGKCIFYKDPTLGFMVAGYGQNGSVNCYDDPTLVDPIAPNYTYDGKQLVNGDNCYVIRNNDLMLPMFPTIRMYAFKLIFRLWLYICVVVSISHCWFVRQYSRLGYITYKHSVSFKVYILFHLKRHKRIF